MDDGELLAQAPTLFHVTSARGWDGVRRRGLLSVERLVELYELDEDDAASFLSRRRATDRRLDHPEHGVAWIRDQRPLSVSVLARMLDDMTVTQYLHRLNSLVFLWADHERLERLWSTARYASTAQVVLELDTASILEAHRDDVVLTRINTGATRGPSGRRGTHTFPSVADFPAGRRVAEFAVAGGLTDLERHLRRVWTRLPQEWRAGPSP